MRDSVQFFDFLSYFGASANNFAFLHTLSKRAK